jgi:hypothetical protein
MCTQLDYCRISFYIVFSQTSVYGHWRREKLCLDNRRLDLRPMFESKLAIHFSQLTPRDKIHLGLYVGHGLLPLRRVNCPGTTSLRSLSRSVRSTPPRSTYTIVNPPSIRKSAPLIDPPTSLARNVKALATSCGSANFPVGIFFLNSSPLGPPQASMPRGVRTTCSQGH